MLAMVLRGTERTGSDRPTIPADLHAATAATDAHRAGSYGASDTDDTNSRTNGTAGACRSTWTPWTCGAAWHSGGAGASRRPGSSYSTTPRSDRKIDLDTYDSRHADPIHAGPARATRPTRASRRSKHSARPTRPSRASGERGDRSGNAASDCESPEHRQPAHYDRCDFTDRQDINSDTLSWSVWQD